MPTPDNNRPQIEFESIKKSDTCNFDASQYSNNNNFQVVQKGANKHESFLTSFLKGVAGCLMMPFAAASTIYTGTIQIVAQVVADMTEDFYKKKHGANVVRPNSAAVFFLGVAKTLTGASTYCLFYTPNKFLDGAYNATCGPNQSLLLGPVQPSPDVGQPVGASLAGSTTQGRGQ